MMWRFNNIALLFLLFAKTALAQSGAPVILVPSWDDLFLSEYNDFPRTILAADSVARKKISYAAIYQVVPAKKKKPKKAKTDTLESWQFDRFGRVVKYRQKEAEHEVHYEYTLRGNISQCVERSVMGTDTFRYFYNRSGQLHRVYYSRRYLVSSIMPARDTIEIFYDVKGSPVARNLKSYLKDENHYLTFEYDDKGRLLKRSKNKGSEGVVETDSLSWRFEKGRAFVSHYFRNLQGEPYTYALVDKVEMDSASGRVLEYSYEFGLGNGNRARGVRGPGYSAHYVYDNEKLSQAVITDNAGRITQLESYRYRDGVQAGYFYARINWSKSNLKENKLRYDCRAADIIFDAKNQPVEWQEHYYTSGSADPQSPTLTEDVKAAIICRVLVR